MHMCAHDNFYFFYTVLPCYFTLYCSFTSRFSTFSGYFFPFIYIYIYFGWEICFTKTTGLNIIQFGTYNQKFCIQSTFCILKVSLIKCDNCLEGWEMSRARLNRNANPHKKQTKKPINLCFVEIHLLRGRLGTHHPRRVKEGFYSVFYCCKTLKQYACFRPRFIEVNSLVAWILLQMAAPNNKG